MANDTLLRLDRILDLAETFLTGRPQAPDWNASCAFAWRRRRSLGSLEALRDDALDAAPELVGLTREQQLVERNTAQFVAGLPANHVLLAGARGTGKSSLVKAMVARHRRQGLRLVEIDRQHLDDLPDVIELLRDRPERFILFLDDLSFDAGDTGYKSLKVALDGSLGAPGDNVLIYATSNRRHLVAENASDNLGYHSADNGSGELHPGDAVEEKISLAERFGLRLVFYPLSEDEYLAIALHWVEHLGSRPKGAKAAAARREALAWSAERGARSGRVAYQFARDYVGRQGLTD
ncbi:ATP-binding protein [Oryzomicrobium sp.]|uniref:ATP-binding protein n=1 Tax=Oryzomicrobium sp. TaxID=1911578 RepID=UPI0025CE98E8|nr:ATP-binding protein [Oryzomicrobium sp.]MCE1243421.1 ATP-binding protein [Oryzomicrobium sp.]